MNSINFGIYDVFRYAVFRTPSESLGEGGVWEDYFEDMTGPIG